jgi:hypothetical protein
MCSSATWYQCVNYSDIEKMERIPTKQLWSQNPTETKLTIASESASSRTITKLLCMTGSVGYPINKEKEVFLNLLNITSGTTKSPQFGHYIFEIQII